MLHFRIGKRCSALRAPVYEAITSVYESLLIQLDKECLYSLVASFVHGEALSAPVAGVSQLAALACYPSAVLLLPCPGSLKELFSAQIFLFQTFFFPYFVYNLYFRCNAGMI